MEKATTYDLEQATKQGTILEIWVDGQKYGALVNIGQKPTFGAQKTQIEAHILQFNGEIYGKKLHLELHFFLRNEKNFKSGEELSQQIQADLTEYNQFLNKENKENP